MPISLTLLILNVETFPIWMAYNFIGFPPHLWRIGVWPSVRAENGLFMCTTFIPCMSLLHDITTHVHRGAKMKSLYEELSSFR